jgi:hypothetical protein
MNAGSVWEFCPALAVLAWRLERWRKKRKGGERIPETLWAAAGELARTHGVNQVSRALRLEFKQLRRAAETCASNSQARWFSRSSFQARRLRVIQSGNEQGCWETLGDQRESINYECRRREESPINTVPADLRSAAPDRSA